MVSAQYVLTTVEKDYTWEDEIVGFAGKKIAENSIVTVVMEGCG